MAVTAPYSLDQFLADTRATIKTKGVPSGLAEIRGHLEKLLHNPELLRKHLGDPVPYTGVSGINVTSKKCLPENWQGGVIALTVNVLGMIQSVARYLFLPFAAFGIYAGIRQDWRMSCLMLATVLYYLVPGTAAHTEIRYVLPMHGLLIVFASVGIVQLIRIIRG